MSESKEVNVLITTMNLQDPISLLNKMNVKKNILIGNQTTYNEVTSIMYNNNLVNVYSFSEKGVGLNRNNILLRANCDYCLFADDDLEYVDNYEELISRYFLKYKDADVIVFNLEEKNSKRFQITKDFKVNYLNFMRFGAARLAVKRKSISMNNIFFNTNFGGGTRYSHGEDTLFLADCLKKGLNVYAVNCTIAKLTDYRESTWFKGYDTKFFNDKGVLYYFMSKRLFKLLCLQDAIRHYKNYNNGSFIDIYRLMVSGVKKYREEE